MNKTLQFLLLALTFLTQTKGISAQEEEDCNNDPPPEELPCSANVICGFENLDMYCLEMEETQLSYAFPGEGLSCFIHDPHWLAFAAGTEQVTLEFNVLSCISNFRSGVQIVIYEGDPVCDGTDISGLEVADIIEPPMPSGGYDCEFYPPTDSVPPFHEFTFNTIPGRPYYIIVDGWEGDLCEIQINVLQGSNPPKNIDTTTLKDINLPEFIGVDSICLGATGVSFCGESLPDGAAYVIVQLPNGEEVRSRVGEICQEIDYEFQTQGFVEFCMAAANDCDTSAFLCREYFVTELSPVYKTDMVNEGEPYTWEGVNINTDVPGTFHFEEIVPTKMTNGCQRLSILDLQVIDIDEDCISDPPPAAYVCDANTICELETLDSYCLNMIDPGVSYEFPGSSLGCLLQAPNWISFVAGEDFIELEFTVQNCQGCNDGVQMAIYEGNPDCSTAPPSGLTEVGGTVCNNQYRPSPAGQGTYNIQFPTTPGYTYSVVFDPWRDCYCDVEFEVIQGDNPPRLSNNLSILPLFLPEFDGRDSICLGATDMTFCARELPLAAEYLMVQLPNGEEQRSALGSECIDLDYEFGTEGTVELCFAAANACERAQFHCCEYIVTELPPVFKIDTVNEGDPYTWEGMPINTDVPGSFHFEDVVQTGQTMGCERFSTLDLEILAVNEDSRPIGNFGSNWLYCLLVEPNHPMNTVSIFNHVIDTFSESEFAYSRIAGSFFDHSTRGIYEDTITMANKGSKVYLQAEDSLYLLYDFGFVSEDTVTFGFPKSLDPEYFENNPNIADNFKLKVDSVNLVEIDGEALKRVYFTQLYDPDSLVHVPTDLGRYYTEKIGYENFLLPYVVTGYDDINTGCDIVEFRSNLFTYINEEAWCPNSVRKQNEVLSKITLFPNPSSSILYIDTELQLEKGVIVDMQGQVIRNVDSSSEHDISSLQPGLYQIRFRTMQGETLSVKFIAQ